MTKKELEKTPEKTTRLNIKQKLAETHGKELVDDYQKVIDELMALNLKRLTEESVNSQIGFKDVFKSIRRKGTSDESQFGQNSSTDSLQNENNKFKSKPFRRKPTPESNHEQNLLIDSLENEDNKFKSQSLLYHKQTDLQKQPIESLQNVNSDYNKSNTYNVTLEQDQKIDSNLKKRTFYDVFMTIHDAMHTQNNAIEKEISVNEPKKYTIKSANKDLLTFIPNKASGKVHLNSKGEQLDDLLVEKLIEGAKGMLETTDTLSQRETLTLTFNIANCTGARLEKLEKALQAQFNNAFKNDEGQTKVSVLINPKAKKPVIPNNSAFFKQENKSDNTKTETTATSETAANFIKITSN